MKRFFVVIGTIALLTGPLLAATGRVQVNQADGSLEAQSLEFTTQVGSEIAWDLRWSGTEWVLSFASNAVVVDDTNPNDTALIGDFLRLPTMVLSGLQDQGGMVTATLHPRGPLEIESFDGDTVFSASIATGGTLAIGTNYVAYSQPNDDLDIRSADESHGMVIGGLVAAERAGFPLDLSFSGDAMGGVNLYNLIRSNSGSAQGTLSGQINAIPEPATLLLLGLGAAAAGWLPSRRRR